MSKPENLLIIDPAQELKFRGKFRDEKSICKESTFFTRKNNIMESKFVQFVEFMQKYDAINLVKRDINLN